MLQRRPYIVLFCITIAAAGLSILYLAHAAAEIPAPYPALKNGMTNEYVTLANNLLAQHVFSMSTTTPFAPDAWRTPGYPAFLAFFYALFGSFYPVLLTQVFLLFLTAALMYRMAGGLVGPRVALVISTVYILLPTTLLSVSVLLTENVFVFCLMSAIYLCIFSERYTMYVRWALAGLLLAATVYVRPASLYIVPFFIVAYFALYLPWKDIRREHVFAAILLCVMFLAALAPWCVRNERVLGVFTFASTGPYVLFRQNAVQFYEATHHIPNLEARYALEDMAGVPRGPVPTDPKYSEALQRVAVQVITEHPVRYAVFHTTTFIPFFTSTGTQDYWRFVQDMDPKRVIPPEPSFIQAIHPFSFPVLMIVLKNHGWTLLENALWATVTLLSIGSLWYSAHRRTMWLFAAIAIYFALVTGPIAHARYRVPAEPLLLIAAASTLVYVWKYGKNFPTLKHETQA